MPRASSASMGAGINTMGGDRVEQQDVEVQVMIHRKYKIFG